MHNIPEALRWKFCSELSEGIALDSSQGLAQACEKCSNWRDCAWYKRAKLCAPSTCVYGIEQVETFGLFSNLTSEFFFCNQSIGVGDANGACANL